MIANIGTMYELHLYILSFVSNFHFSDSIITLISVSHWVNWAETCCSGSVKTMVSTCSYLYVSLTT